MFAIIIAVILLVAGFIGSSAMAGHNAKELKDYPGSGDLIPEGLVKAPRLAGILLAIVILAASCISIVPTGYTGILTTFGKVEDRTIGSGINFVAPWQQIVKMDNRTQKIEIQTSAFSSDIQQVDLVLSVNYCIDQTTAQKLYRTVGLNYYDNVMYPRIQENVKAVIAHYTAENLIGKRDILSDQIAETTAADMRSYGITIVSIAVEDIDFTDAFTNAVEAKQVAAQNKLTAETQQAQKTMEEKAAAERSVIVANAEAEKAVIAANADLEVVKVQAEAALYAGEKEAEMHKRISESLAGDIIQYYWIKQWNGELPTTVLGGDASYMIDLTRDPTSNPAASVSEAESEDLE